MGDCDQDKSATSCRCACEIRGFLQPRLLLLLAQKRTHGYELMEALRSCPAEASVVDPGMLYRTLRQFERDGAVTSTWDTGGRGPARRVYELTAVGREYLETWAADIRKTRTELDQFLTEYESTSRRRVSTNKRKRV